MHLLPTIDGSVTVPFCRMSRDERSAYTFYNKNIKINEPFTEFFYKALDKGLMMIPGIVTWLVLPRAMTLANSYVSLFYFTEICQVPYT